MPYKSDSQRRWAHTDEGEKALGGPEGVHEWDEASKGKKLPEKVKKMAGGGIAESSDTTSAPSVTGGQEQDPFYAELGQGMTEGVNHDMDAVKEYIMKLFGQPMMPGPTLGTDTTGLQGIANKEAEAPNMAGGGISFGHKEKSGPSLTKSVNMADGGMTPDDFSVGGDDTTVNTPDVTKYSMADPNALPPAAQDMPMPTAPKFNPQSGLPPVAPPQPTQPMPLPGTASNPALTQYLQQQKQAIGQYGPQQMMDVENQILQRQNGLGGRLASAGGGLADAIMQGVARAGNPGFQKNIEEREQAQGNQVLGTLERARGANLQNIEAGQKLDAMDPTSAFSKAEQATYAPLFAKLGYKPEQLGTMSAANIQNALQLMTQFGGKQIEMMIKQFELQQKQQEINETHRANVSKEATEEEKTKLGGAETIAKPPTSFLERLAGPISGAMRGQAAKTIEKAAGIQPPGVPDGRVAVISPTGQIGHIPADQLQDALSQGYKEQ